MRVADWVLRDGTGPEDEVAALARSLDLPPLVARLLWMRGQTTTSRARRFLTPRLADLSPPEGLSGIDGASERLARATREGERIAICGDYDVDGMTGTALLVRFFRLMGGDCTWAIPDRKAHGYGLHPDMIDTLAERGVKVAVTVDNGISAHEALLRAQHLGIDVVITDHHLPGADLPPACAIVNPHLDDGDELGQPCGCALAFKLAWAVADRLRSSFDGEQMKGFRAFLRDGVALAAMASVTDAVPLVGENRVLVAAGLNALRQTVHPGLRALLAVAKVGNQPITTEDVGFRIGPRMNAAGRLSQPELVVDLLTSDDREECKRLAQALDDANRERREIESGVLEEALQQADELTSASSPSSLVVAGEGWHQGVIGIVAARLVDRYGVPSVVIGLDGEKGRGSGRTPGAVNLHDAFQASAEHLGRYGGHAMAAGLEIESAKVDAFRAAFEQASIAQLDGAPLRPVLDIDVSSSVNEWDLPVIQAMRRLAPFGKHNPEPVVLVKGAQVAGKPRLMGAGDAHLSFALKQEFGAIRVVGFRQAARYELAASGKPLDLAVTPVLNEWRGNITAEFRLHDMRPAKE